MDGIPGRLDTDDFVLPLTEYLRRAAITAARNRDVGIVATNSDGSQARRDELLKLLGPDSVERVIDPGQQVVEARLSPTGTLDPQCREAIRRWYR